MSGVLAANRDGSLCCGKPARDREAPGKPPARDGLFMTLLALLLVVTAACLRLRRFRPPAQGCGR